MLYFEKALSHPVHSHTYTYPNEKTKYLFIETTHASSTDLAKFGTIMAQHEKTSIDLEILGQLKFQVMLAWLKKSVIFLIRRKLW